jgi:hypothetical protein
VPDLTPQLRTRLTRVERATGLFVLLAMLLLVAGFGWYIYQTGVRKGWFVTRVRYCTSLYSAAGLKVGDPVTLMGFKVGEITRIDGQPPEEFYGVYVEFTVRAPYFGFLWTAGSKVRVSPTDFLGNRAVEVTKGTNYLPTHLIWDIGDYPLGDAGSLVTNRNKLLVDPIRNPESLTNRDAEPWLVLVPLDTNLLARLAAEGRQRVRLAERATFSDKELKSRPVTAMWDLQANSYVAYRPDSKPYWLPPDETPALTDRLEAMVRETELALTNQLLSALTQLTAAGSNANAVLAATRPMITNLTVIASHLSDPDGSLGRWMLPPDLYAQVLAATTNVNTTLLSANVTLTNTTTVLTNTSALLTSANTNVAAMVAQLEAPLRELSTIVSNLNLQVTANTNFVTTLNGLLLHSDELIQGFKRHWFLRSAFKEKPPPKPKPTNAPPRRLMSPKGASMWGP